LKKGYLQKGGGGKIERKELLRSCKEKRLFAAEKKKGDDARPPEKRGLKRNKEGHEELRSRGGRLQGKSMASCAAERQGEK